MLRTPNLRRATLTLAVLAASTAPVFAQSLLDESAAQPPGAPAVISGVSASDSILATRENKAAPVVDAQAVTPVPFEQPISAYRLSGEEPVGRYSFHLSDAQAAAGGALHLSYRNAVSVLPDTAAIDVSINGKEAGSIRVASPNGFTTETIPAAAGLLKAGRNTVVLKARQFHRVDCSVDASYELWTEFDSSATGFVSSAPAAFDTVDDLLTLGRDQSGATDIRLILPARATTEMLTSAAPVLQTLALYLDRPDIAVTVASTPGTGPGVDLSIVTDEQTETGSIGYGLTVRPTADPRRAAATFRAAGSGDIGRQLVADIAGPLKASLDTGIFAAEQGVIRAQAGMRYTLAGAGQETRIFTGRLAQVGVDLVMPADFYPADYGTIGLRLHAATSPGLKRTAQLVVRVNGKAVSSYSFRDPNGQQLNGKLLELPMRAFHPGVNRVDILAELPAESDAACLTPERTDTRPRFILLKETEFEIPALARIARLPDIGAFAGTAFPYADGETTNLFIERPDAQSMGAAFTMLSRLALAARNPLNVAVRTGPPQDDKGRNAIIIASAQSFAELGAPAAKSMPSLQTAQASNPDNPFPVLDQMRTSALTDPVLAPGGGDSGALLDAFRKTTTRADDDLPFLSRLQQWTGVAGSRFSQWLSYGEAEPQGMDGQSDNALLSLSQMRSPDGTATWTVINAKTPTDLNVGTRRLTEAGMWDRLQGGTVEVATANLAVISKPAPEHFVASLDDKSPGNLRRIAAAWFSDNFQIYVLLIVVLMGIFAIWLGRTIPRRGVRTGE